MPSHVSHNACCRMMSADQTSSVHETSFGTTMTCASGCKAGCPPIDGATSSIDPGCDLAATYLGAGCLCQGPGCEHHHLFAPARQETAAHHKSRSGSCSVTGGAVAQAVNHCQVRSWHGRHPRLQHLKKRPCNITCCLAQLTVVVRSYLNSRTSSFSAGVNCLMGPSIVSRRGVRCTVAAARSCVSLLPLLFGLYSVAMR